jgi:hypothetical protein
LTKSERGGRGSTLPPSPAEYGPHRDGKQVHCQERGLKAEKAQVKPGTYLTDLTPPEEEHEHQQNNGQEVGQPPEITEPLIIARESGQQKDQSYSSGPQDRLSPPQIGQVGIEAAQVGAIDHHHTVSSQQNCDREQHIVKAPPDTEPRHPTSHRGKKRVEQPFQAAGRLRREPVLSWGEGLSRTARKPALCVTFTYAARA